MNKIKLEVKKETFRKYFIYMNLSYKIKMYDSFILAIKRHIHRELMNAMREMNFEETMYKIFGGDASMIILSDMTKINKISSIYLKEKIKEGIFDLYLEREYLSYSKTIQKDAFLYKKIRNLRVIDKGIQHILKNTYKDYLKGGSKEKTRVKRCANEDAIFLLDDEKNIILEEINKEIIETIFAVKRISLNNIKNKISSISLINLENNTWIENYIKYNILDGNLTDKSINMDMKLEKTDYQYREELDPYYDLENNL